MVTRQIGDQTHTIIHRKDGNGNEETQEDLVNIDGGKQLFHQMLAHFFTQIQQKTWQEKSKYIAKLH